MNFNTLNNILTDLATANYNSNNVSILTYTTPTVTITAGTTPIQEGTSSTFTITLDESAPSEGTVVNFNLTGSTATIGDDFTLTAGSGISSIDTVNNTLTIAPGATTATINLNALFDEEFFEADETVQINLTSGTDYILGSNTTSLFNPQTTFAVGSSPRSTAVGDFNGDGNLDLAVGNRNSGNVSIRLGDGNGGFSTATTVSVGTNPRAIAVEDFNGDGDIDLAVANRGTNNVSIRLGDGSGGFTTGTTLAVGTNPYSVAVGDFNGDGDIDLAIANQTSNNVSIRLGDGNGGFTTATTLAVGSTPLFVTVGDFDRDGNVDLAVANSGDNNLSILLGGGNGSFSTATLFTVGSTPYSVTVGDFNGDGKPDLVAANRNGNDVSVLLNADPSAVITIENVPNQTPVVDNPIEDQETLEQIAFSFTVPADTFSDPEGGTLTYTATLSDGSALPDGLEFDASNLTFSGTLPSPITLMVKVRATDSGNLFVEDTFNLDIKPLPTLVTRGTGLADTLTGGIGLNNIDGGGSNDSIEGNVVADTIRGGSGNDTLKGLNGNDLVDGGSGNDTMEGGNGLDTLLGGSGNDTLKGGMGNDTLTGGSGVDAFLFNSSSEGLDSITDFKVTEDRIWINNSGFGGSFSPGTLDSSAFVIGSSATGGSPTFIYNPSTGLLSFDADGNTYGGGSAIPLAQLRGGLAMSNSNIIVFDNV